MKTTNRASRKAGKKSTSAQSAKLPEITPGKSQIAVRICAEIGGTPLGQLEVPGDFCHELVIRANREGYTSLPVLIVDILRKEAREQGRGCFPLVEFEATLQRAAGLLGLIQKEFGSYTSDRSHEESLRLRGYMNLVHEAGAELNKLFYDVIAWLQAMPTSAVAVKGDAL